MPYILTREVRAKIGEARQTDYRKVTRDDSVAPPDASVERQPEAIALRI